MSLSGATDLEAPDWNVRAWGSAALFELQPHHVGGHGRFSAVMVEASIPLHLRYLEPSSSGGGAGAGKKHVDVPPPVVFWACTTPASSSSTSEYKDDEEARLDLTINPFDRIHIGYDALFPEGTVFHHLQHRVGGVEGLGGLAGTEGLAGLARTEKLVGLAELAGGKGHQSSTTQIPVPVLDLTNPVTQYVQVGTVVSVILGFVWVLWCLVKPIGGGGGAGVGGVGAGGVRGVRGKVERGKVERSGRVGVDVDGEYVDGEDVDGEDVGGRRKKAV